MILKRPATVRMILLGACDKPNIRGKEVVNMFFQTIYKGYDNLYVDYFILIYTYL